MGTTDLEPMRDFESKIKERLSKDIADLIPDEALTSLIEKSIDRVFFKRRVTRTNTWGEAVEDRPSLFEELVGELLEKKFRKIALEYLAANEEKVDEIIDKMVGENWALSFANGIKSVFADSFIGFEAQFRQKLRENTYP